MNKNLMIGLGVLAVAGIAYYMYKKPKATTGAGAKTADTGSETSSKFSNATAVKCKCDAGCSDRTTILACKECCSGCKGKSCQGVPNYMMATGVATKKSTNVNIYACFEGRRCLVYGDGTIKCYSQKCDGTESMIIE
jgi:hypothetical protein